MKKISYIEYAPKINHEQMRDLIIQKYLYQGKKSALFFWGAPGIGKSYNVREAAKILANMFKLKYTEDWNHIDDENYFMMIDLRASMCDPTDAKGIPNPNKEKRITEWLVGEMWPSKGRGIIFLDEFTHAPDLTRKSFYQPILDGRIYKKVIPDTYLLIAASNERFWKSGTTDLEFALRTRFSHYTLKIPTAEEWIRNYAGKANIYYSIIGYLQSYPSHIFHFDPNDPAMPWPCPRSWEFASNDIYALLNYEKKIEKVKLYQECGLRVGANCGPKYGENFEVWLRLTDKHRIDPYTYINNPKKIKEVKETYLILSLLNELTGIFKNSPSKYIDPLLKISKLLRADFRVAFLTMMKNSIGNTAFKETLRKSKEFDAETTLTTLKYLV